MDALHAVHHRSPRMHFLLAVTAAHSLVQHANVRMRTGALGRVFAAPELHRLHHSSRADELGTNYGDVPIVRDALLGTPAGRPGARRFAGGVAARWGPTPPIPRRRAECARGRRALRLD